MNRELPLYFLTTALLAVSVYLLSPMIAVAIVGLWGVRAAEAIFTRKNRDSDIAEIMDTMRSHKAKMDMLTRDIGNVAERAKTILGENF